MAVALRLQYFRRGEACIAGNSHPFSKLPKSSLVLGGKPQEILRGKASIPVFRNVKKPLSFSSLPKPPQRTQQGRVPPGASAAPSRGVPWPRSAPLPRSAARPRRRHCSGAARAGRTAGARSAPRGSALPPPVRPPRRFPAAAALGSGSLYFRAKGKTEKKEKAKVGIPPPVTAGIKGHRAAPQEEKRRGRQRGAERRSPAGRRQRAAEERGRRTPVLLLAVLSAGALLWMLATWKTNVLQVSAGPVHELPCLGNSPLCLELKMKTIQFSARKDLILDAVFHSLKDNGIDGLKREEILQLTREAVEKVMKHYTWMPSWSLKTVGATIDAERTSKSYGGNRWLSPFLFSAKPPETILQPDISTGNCWAFQGSRGHVVIRLPEKIWPTAFTIWHISKAVSPSGEVSTAPREFAVSGVDEDEGEALLGSFVYDVDGEIAQTFQVQEEPRKAFRQIKLEVRSNWGNAEYTCLYRADVHGNPEKT